MHLSKLEIVNFRVYGAGEKALTLEFRPGLTLLVGPNDGGKSTILDALRLVLGTSSRDTYRLDLDDFHIEGSDRAESLQISCRFEFANQDEAALFCEYCTIIDNKFVLILKLNATMDEGRSRRPVVYDVRTGLAGDGATLDANLRAYLAATYLRALRDAVHELTAGRGSRLSQILAAHPKFKDQGTARQIPSEPKTLVEIMQSAEEEIERNDAIAWVREQINNEYLLDLSLASDLIRGDIGVTRKAGLRDILEKLDLWIAGVGSEFYKSKRGLGTNNILYIASELLLTSAAADDTLPLLLIEEPEAHLHPQMQLLLGDYLQTRSESAISTSKAAKAHSNAEHTDAEARQPSSDDKGHSSTAKVPLQIIATTHSPTLASQISLDQIVVVIKGRAYPLRRGDTALAEGDYRFLSRFLDATRANLFFAYGVIIVEGDAENLLFPVLAKLLGRPLNKHGVSIVKVGTIGLFRYSRIFQSKNREERIPIKVACVTDLDLKPNATDGERRERRKTRMGNDAGSVRTFVSPIKTLEFDLAATAFAQEMHLAIQLAKAAKNQSRAVNVNDADILSSAKTSFNQFLKENPDDPLARAALICEPLENGVSKTETAQYFGELLANSADVGMVDASSLRKRLPNYLVDAIDYVTSMSTESNPLKEVSPG